MQRNNWTGIFSKQFLFLNGYRVLSETLSKLRQNFSKGLSIVQSMYPWEQFEVKVFFLKIANESFSRNFCKNLCPFPSKKTPGTTIKNGLFSCRLTQSMKWFSRENIRFRRFNWILRRKTPAELSKKGLRWQKNNWGKWFFTSIDLILEIFMSHRTFFFGFWLKVLNRDVNTAFSASRWTKSAKISFFGKNYQFQFSVGF